MLWEKIPMFGKILKKRTALQIPILCQKSIALQIQNPAWQKYLRSRYRYFCAPIFAQLKKNKLNERAFYKFQPCSVVLDSLLWG